MLGPNHCVGLSAFSADPVYIEFVSQHSPSSSTWGSLSARVGPPLQLLLASRLLARPPRPVWSRAPQLVCSACLLLRPSLAFFSLLRLRCPSLGRLSHLGIISVAFSSVWHLRDSVHLNHLHYVNHLSPIHLLFRLSSCVWLALARLLLCSAIRFLLFFPHQLAPQVRHVEMLQAQHVREVSQLVETKGIGEDVNHLPISQNILQFHFTTENSASPTCLRSVAACRGQRAWTMSATCRSIGTYCSSTSPLRTHSYTKW